MGGGYGRAVLKGTWASPVSAVWWVQGSHRGLSWIIMGSFLVWGQGPKGFIHPMLQSSCGLISVSRVSSSERWVYGAEDSQDRAWLQGQVLQHLQWLLLGHVWGREGCFPLAGRHRLGFIPSIYCACTRMWVCAPCSSGTKPSTLALDTGSLTSLEHSS